MSDDVHGFTFLYHSKEWALVGEKKAKSGAHGGLRDDGYVRYDLCLAVSFPGCCCIREMHDMR